MDRVTTRHAGAQNRAHQLTIGEAVDELYGLFGQPLLLLGDFAI